MISCNLKGGICNVLFQTAAVESIAKDGNLKTFYFNIERHIKYLNDDKFWIPNMNHANDYLKMFKNFNWNINEKHPVPQEKLSYPFHYQKPLIKDNVYYDGYFQSEKYFVHNRDFIYNLFEPSEFSLEQLQKYDTIINGITCALHVRRQGGYKTMKHIHPPIDLSYINMALKEIGHIDKLIVCSDDIEWCKNNLKFNNIYFVENEKDYIEMFLMSRCNHNIISNSSFSWWSAWLNKNKKKKVVAPKNWFGLAANYNSKDIVPESWIQI